MAKVIYIEYTEEVGEVEGAFDNDGNLLHIWSCNDASWRHEYFNPIFEKLGITVKSGRFDNKLEAIAEEMWG